MKSITMRYLKTEDNSVTGGSLMTRNSEGLLVFDSKFRKELIEQYEHYCHKDTKKLVQISKDYKLVGVYSPPFNAVSINPFTDVEMMEILKRLVLNRTKFKLVLDISDYDLDYFNDLGILNQNSMSNKEYILLLEENKEEFLPILIGIRLFDNSNKPNYLIEITPQGIISYREYTKESYLSDAEVIKLMFKICGYLELEETFDSVKMVEKPIVPSPYSKLYVLMDYIDAHRDTLPHQVAEALGYAGLEESLKQLGENNKNKSQYKN